MYLEWAACSWAACTVVVLLCQGVLGWVLSGSSACLGPHPHHSVWPGAAKGDSVEGMEQEDEYIVSGLDGL
jgi:hypothetical protein